MRRVVLAAAAAHALQHAPRQHGSSLLVAPSKRSVSDLIGNQHGGKYNFDGSYVEIIFAAVLIADEVADRPLR